MEASREPEPLIVNAEPTKDFFILMLVRDIELIPAIADLVDNSLDGARDLRGDESFEGLKVDLTVRPDRFAIEDNCGGMEVGKARDYAFRFGRPEGFPALEHSIGQFGVGMKRALFKLGKRFVVESTAERSRFGLTVPVDDWREQEEWTFEFDEGTVEENLPEPIPEADRGTTITVTELNQAVVDDFGSEQKVADLRADLERRHQLSIAKGLEISVNGSPLEPEPVHFAVSDSIKPAELELAPNGVGVKLLAGIAESDGNAGGWYVFCNDRLVLAADQSPVTGWGWRDGGARIPKFHAQYARFRGYAFFDADDASLLPWNTTKTNVDLDSAVFRQARREMLALGRPVLDFLNVLSDERTITRNSDPGPLQVAVREAEESLQPFNDIEYGQNFQAPEAVLTPERPTMSAIHYDRPIAQIDQMKDLLGANSNKEVGERTFDQFYEEAFGEADGD